MRPDPLQWINRIRTSRVFCSDDGGEKLRKAIVFLIPCLLCLPFAGDLTRALPPLTMTLYISEDGRSYVLNETDLDRPRPLTPVAERIVADNNPPGVSPDAGPDSGIPGSVSGSVKSTRLSMHPIPKQPGSPPTETELATVSIKKESAEPDLTSLYGLSSHSPSNAWQIISKSTPTAYRFPEKFEIATSDLLDIWKLQSAPTALMASTTRRIGVGSASVSPARKNKLIFSERPRQRPLIVIDPGHGGSDPGTVGSAGLLEKELTLDIAKRLKALAEADGEIDIQLTRNRDKGMSRQSRLNAVTRRKPDLLLSLHFNNLPQKDVAVVETFYADVGNILESKLLGSQRLAHQRRPDDESRNEMMAVAANISNSNRADVGSQIIQRARQSKRLASIVQRHVFQTIARHDENVQDNGIKRDTLYMLTQSKVPGALIELSCLSHPDEENRLLNKKYRQWLAMSLLEALLEYVEQSQVSTAA